MRYATSKCKKMLILNSIGCCQNLYNSYATVTVEANDIMKKISKKNIEKKASTGQFLFDLQQHNSFLHNTKWHKWSVPLSQFSVSALDLSRTHLE